MSIDTVNPSPEAYVEPADSSLEVLVDLAMREGLDSSLEELYASPEYHERAARYKAVQNGTAELTPAQRWAVERGVHTAGAMLSLDYSHETTDYNGETPDMPDYTDLAMVEAFGRKCIDYVRTNLPYEAKELAERWRTGDLDQRLTVIRDSRQYFSFNTWQDAQDMEADILDEHGQRIMDYTEPLPRYCTGWPNVDRTNCLGMSVLLSAFAEECGATYMYVNQVRTRRDRIWEDMGDFMEETKAYVAETDAILTDHLTARLDRNGKKADKVSAMLDDFHHNIVMEIKPGIWIELDPYMGTGAYLDDSTSQVNETHALLEDISDAVPGITINRSDTVAIDHFKTRIKERLDKSFAISEALRAYIQICGIKLEDIQTIGELEKLLTKFSNHIGKDMAEGDLLLEDVYEATYWLPIVTDLKQELKSIGVTLDDEPAPERKEQFDAELMDIIEMQGTRFMDDAEFREKKIGASLSAPIIGTLNSYFDQFNYIANGTVFPNAAMEYAKPAFMTGAMIINHLRSWSDYGNKYQGSRLARFSSSQVLWHEAMQDQDPPQDPVLERTERLLRKWPSRLLHPRVELRLLSIPVTPDEPEEAPSAPQLNTGQRGQEDC